MNYALVVSIIFCLMKFERINWMNYWHGLSVLSKNVQLFIFYEYRYIIFGNEGRV
jgi:hypothetical protein